MRVRFVRDIVEPACGDHPDLLVAARGTQGELHRNVPGGDWPYRVVLDDGRYVHCRRNEVVRADAPRLIRTYTPELLFQLAEGETT